MPVALLEPVAPADREPLDRVLLRAADYDWLVFSSANAVRFSAPGLPLRSELGGLRVACIGPATAQAAREAGLPVHLVPSEQALPESLATELVADGGLAGRRVLLPRAEQAQDILSDALVAAGARVEAPTAYRTRCPEGAGRALQQALRDGLDAVTLTSPSTVGHLFGLLSGDAARDLVENAVFACIGPTTLAALAERGVTRSVVAERQTMEGLVDALERAFAEGPHGVS